MSHALWGTEYEDYNIEPLLEGNDDLTFSRFESSSELCRTTARLLADGNVVGWYQGRMEWGARALGNRSILADPRRADMRELINAKIKFREKFRPFAPSVLEEAVSDYFVNPALDPFMQQVYPVREDKRPLVPAITHVDGSGRLQTVNEAQNPLYYRLIREFANITALSDWSKCATTRRWDETTPRRCGRIAAAAVSRSTVAVATAPPNNGRADACACSSTNSPIWSIVLRLFT